MELGLETRLSADTDRSSLASRDSQQPLLYRNDSNLSTRASLQHASQQQQSTQRLASKRWQSFSSSRTPRQPQTLESAESITAAEDAMDSYIGLAKPTESDVQEIEGLLKVKTSMLAMGACERVKKLARLYPTDIIHSPILKELLNIIMEGPATPLAGGAISALVTLALVPEGRQHIVLLGGATPIVRFLSRCDLQHANTAKALQLLMNLAADSANRRLLRESKAVEVVVQLMNKCPLGPLMAHSMGALHNIMLTDSKAKQRAVDANVVAAIARVLASEPEEGAQLGVRAHMLISDLLRVEDMQSRLVTAARAQNLYIPGLMSPPPDRHKPQGLSPAGSDDEGEEDKREAEEGDDRDSRSSTTTPLPGDTRTESQQLEGQQQQQQGLQGQQQHQQQQQQQQGHQGQQQQGGAGGGE